MASDFEELVETCERICVVLRTMAEQLAVERGDEDPKVVLLRSIVSALEVRLRKAASAPFDDTPLPGATFVEKLLTALEDPRGHLGPLVVRWFRRHVRQSIILVTEMSKALEVYGSELELVDGAKRWLDRVTYGPSGDDDHASSE